MQYYAIIHKIEYMKNNVIYLFNNISFNVVTSLFNFPFSSLKLGICDIDYIIYKYTTGGGYSEKYGCDNALVAEIRFDGLNCNNFVNKS